MEVVLINNSKFIRQLSHPPFAARKLEIGQIYINIKEPLEICYNESSTSVEGWVFGSVAPVERGLSLLTLPCHSVKVILNTEDSSN